MTNPRSASQDDTRDMIGDALFLASVIDTDGNRVRIQRLGQAADDDQFYPAYAGLAASLSPGDVVECHVIGGQVIVAGQVTT